MWIGNIIVMPQQARDIHNHECILQLIDDEGAPSFQALVGAYQRCIVSSGQDGYGYYVPPKLVGKMNQIDAFTVVKHESGRTKLLS